MPKSSKTVAPAVRKSRTAKAQPTHDQIAQRAYEIYLERGATSSDPMQDWLRAELELSAPAKKPRSKSKVITFAA